MANLIAAVTADTHLAQRAWLKYPGIVGDSYYAFEQIVKYCTANDLDLFLAGDVFDKTRPDPLTIWNCRHQLDKMERQSLGVYYIQGQHELDRNTPWLLSVSDWPEHFSGTTIKCKDVKLYGLDWTPADKVQQEFAKIPADTDVLVAHQVWKDFMGNKVPNTECKFSDVPHVKLIITGDFHVSVIAFSTNASGNPVTALSPGSTCMQSINEDTVKYFYVLDDTLNVFPIKLKSRQCFKFDINDEKSLEVFRGYKSTFCEPQKEVPDYIAKNIVYVKYNDAIPDIYKKLITIVGNDAHLFMSPVKEQKEVITIETEKRRKLADGGLESCLELAVPKDSKLYYDVLSLLRCTDVSEQLDVIKEAFYNGERK